MGQKACASKTAIHGDCASGHPHPPLRVWVSPHSGQFTVGSNTLISVNPAGRKGVSLSFSFALPFY